MAALPQALARLLSHWHTYKDREASWCAVVMERAHSAGSRYLRALVLLWMIHLSIGRHRGRGLGRLLRRVRLGDGKAWVRIRMGVRLCGRLSRVEGVGGNEPEIRTTFAIVSA